MSDFIEQHAVEMDHDGFLEAVRQLKLLIEEDPQESQLQQFLESHRYILSEQFAHCHHVFPRVRLGERFEADFFCLDLPSYGNEWIAIEIEPTNFPVVTRAGRKSAKLEHALQQVRDWRIWVTNNIDYARRPRTTSGLGLEEIGPRFQGYVIIGRRRDYTPTFNALRRQVSDDEMIQIRSWDGIVERAEQRANILAGFRASIFRSD